MSDINSKRFELELQLAADKNMNIEQKVQLIEHLLQMVEGEADEEKNNQSNS